MAMDLITSPTSVSLAAPTSLLTRNRTPDSDPDTPPPPTQIYPKWVHQKHHHAPVELEVVVTYKECLKNHAASIGGHALDGCCEFMPGPTCNPSDPTSLKCAACGCHRNFHRRDPDDPTPLHHHPPAAARGPHSPSSASRLLLSLAHEETNPAPVTGNGAGGQNGNFTTMSSSSNSRKRFRTKFSQEQKDKMHEFSEKIGWKLKRGEEKLIEEFCKQVGVGRSVFKVWMHNNKHSSSSIRKDNLSLDAPNYIININSNANNTSNNDTNGVHHHFYSNGVVLQEQE